MKLINSLLLIVLSSLVLSVRASTIHYAGNFTPVPGGPAISSSLSASLDAHWNPVTNVFEDFRLTISQLPIDTTLNSWLFSIGSGGYQYGFDFSQLASIQEDCCGYYFDSASGVLEFHLSPAFSTLATLSEAPENAYFNNQLDMAIARNALSSGLVDFTIYDVFDSAAAPLKPSGLPALQALFVSSDQAIGYPDRIPVNVASAVPLPSAVWLFSSALLVVIGFVRPS